MLAVAGELPSDSSLWGFEYKWDGVRCLAYWDGKTLKLVSRNHIVITQRYPELAGLAAALGTRPAILDGEIIALDRRGKPSFSDLQLRMHVNNPTPALVRATPAWFVIFDLLHDGDASTLELPYIRRRELLESRVGKGHRWHVSPWSAGDGEAMLENARRNALEGVVAKQLSGPYLPGRRSPSWRKIKVIFRQELVIGGWIPEGRQRVDRVGALLLGYFTQDAARPMLQYAGRVGSGFSDATHAKLSTVLRKLASTERPFEQRVPGPGALFVKPQLVAEVEYRRWPENGLIQQAAFKGLRTDKPAAKVVKEPQSGDAQ